MENRDCTNIAIANSLVEEIKRHILNTEFKSVDEYITFVLKEVLEDKNTASASGLTQEEENQVKENLKKLGYL